MGGYVKTFKVKDEYKYKNNKLISSNINWKYDQKLLEKYKIFWNGIEDLKILSWILYQFMIIDT